MDLNKCDHACLTCVRNYKKKHNLVAGQQFKIKCKGITDYSNLNLFNDETDNTASYILDPVKWAAETLDWHCLDPDGEIWKRRNPEEYETWVSENPDTPILGHSRYHRPYQATMLRCSSRRKVFRIGRQCLTGDTKITLSNGQHKPISDIKPDDIVISLNEKTSQQVSSRVTRHWNAGQKEVFLIKTRFGHEIKCTSDHRFYVSNTIGTNSIKAEWLSIDTGLVLGTKIATSENKNILWDYVSSITPVGTETTYDIEIENTHNFIANGIYTHNSGKTESLVISILYHMFTKPGVPVNEGFDVVIITPYQSQIDLIFKRIMQLIRSSPNTQNALFRSVKAPIYTIELYNNSKVAGFTAGTKSGGNAEAVRGQHANMLVFDEADYLASKDMDAAWSIITNYPQASIWMSSTPSGKREKFFNTCSSKVWKEFHFPSQVNPMWGEDQEAFFQENMTSIAYKHEVMAEFGEQEEGVFQNSYVQTAMQDYRYQDMAPNPGWTYSFGVDWNDTAIGTTIVVLGFNPTVKKFIVVDRHIVSRENWTQLAACQKIANLNRVWNPMAIYIDAGYGGTQDEVLRKFGYDSMIDPAKGPSHPDSKLRNIVKKYFFGGSVETHDLFTHQITKKPGKAFLVENTVRRFEASDIHFSKFDDVLQRQLQGYVVKRRSVSGVPIFAAEEDTIGDHTLDALMLSIMAFTLEVSPLGKPKIEVKMAFSGNIGERTDPIIHEGDLVIDNPYRNKTKPTSKPTTDRTHDIVETSLISVNKSIPASHMRETQLSLWNNPNFSHDGPAPRSLNLAEREKRARSRLGFKQTRPRRKNI